jgi:hypothetical protein
VRAQAAAMRKGGEERRDRSSRVLDSKVQGRPHALALATDAAFPPLEIEGPCAVLAAPLVTLSSFRVS